MIMLLAPTRRLPRGVFFFSSRRRHTRYIGDWSSDVCSSDLRDGQAGTWIVPEIIAAYTALHRMGLAHSVEAWREGQLVGGLYGVALGRAFFGESKIGRASCRERVRMWVGAATGGTREGRASG